MKDVKVKQWIPVSGGHCECIWDYSGCHFNQGCFRISTVKYVVDDREKIRLCDDCADRLLKWQKEYAAA